MEKKTVIITGGNRGIGYDISRIFPEDGYEVFVGARTDYDLRKSLGDNVHFIETDVCNEEDHKQLVKVAIEKTGRLDVYINNAGFSQWRSIENIDSLFLDDVGLTLFRGTSSLDFFFMPPIIFNITRKKIFLPL